MKTQNVTLALPLAVLNKAKVIAAKRQLSLSRLLTQQIEKLIAQEKNYPRARSRQLTLLNHAPDLGTYGNINAKREELHE